MRPPHPPGHNGHTPARLTTVADYDDESRADGKGKDKTAKSKVLAEYEQYLRRELPPLVQHDLECQLEKQLNCVEDVMKIKVVEIFRAVQLKLFRTFTFQATVAPPDSLDPEPPLPLPEKLAEVPKPKPKTPGLSAAETLVLPEMRPSDLFADVELAALLEGPFELASYFQVREPLDLYDSPTTVTDSAYGTMSNSYSISGTE